MEKRFVVYMHTTPSNKRYVGITSNRINRRWQNGFGYRNNPYFFNAILKYGWDNIRHEILYEDLSKEDACQIEVELISKYKSNDAKYGYNLSLGGENPYKGFVSEETKEKIRKANLGKKASKETREKMGKAHRGTHHSEESKKKMSDAKKGKNNAMYGTKWSDQKRDQMKRLLGKPVMCVETKTIYMCLKDAERMTGISDSGIQLVCKGKRQTAGGLHWMYLDEVSAIV